MTDTMTDTLETYAARGWSIFPLDGKTPRVKWRDVSTTDGKKLAAMFGKRNGTNIGVDCGKSGLVVIDLDVKEGTNGLATWHELGVDDTGALDLLITFCDLISFKNVISEYHSSMKKNIVEMDYEDILLKSVKMNDYLKIS